MENSLISSWDACESIAHHPEWAAARLPGAAGQTVVPLGNGDAALFAARGREGWDPLL